MWQNMVMLYMEPMAATAWYHAQRLCVANTNTAHVATPIVDMTNMQLKYPVHESHAYDDCIVQFEYSISLEQMLTLTMSVRLYGDRRTKNRLCCASIRHQQCCKATGGHCYRNVTFVVNCIKQQAIHEDLHQGDEGGVGNAV